MYREYPWGLCLTSVRVVGWSGMINQAPDGPPGVCLDGCFKPSQKCKNGNNHPFGSWNICSSSPKKWCLTMLGSWVITQWNSETPSAPRSVASALLTTLNRGSKYGLPPFISFLPGTLQLSGPFCWGQPKTSYCTCTIQPSGTGLGFALASSVPLAASIGLAEKGLGQVAPCHEFTVRSRIFATKIGKPSTRNKGFPQTKGDGTDTHDN